MTYWAFFIALFRSIGTLYLITCIGIYPCSVVVSYHVLVYCIFFSGQLESFYSNFYIQVYCWLNLLIARTQAYLCQVSIWSNVIFATSAFGWSLCTSNLLVVWMLYFGQTENIIWSIGKLKCFCNTKLKKHTKYSNRATVWLTLISKCVLVSRSCQCLAKGFICVLNIRRFLTTLFAISIALGFTFCLVAGRLGPTRTSYLPSIRAP